MKPIVIDIHAHYIPKGLIAGFEAHHASFPGVKLLRDSAGDRLHFPEAEPTRPMLPRVSDLVARRAWMDEARIDHQVLGLWTDAEGYELDAKQGLAWSRFINDCMWDELKGEPRFSPLASVPLQDGKLAADVLAEALDRGFAGAMIGTLPAGARGGRLDDPSLDPFWEPRHGWAPESFCTRCTCAAIRGSTTTKW